MPSMYEAAQVGKRQEIADRIFNVQAEKTPFLSLLPQGPKPEQMLLSWVGEVNPAAASTGILDGTPATSPKKVDRYLIEGCCQHFRREWGVTTLAQLTNVVGAGRDEAGRQMAKAMMIIKRMIEQQILSNDDCAVESGATPWTTRGLLQWIVSSAQTNKPLPASFLVDSACIYTGALASLTESAFRTMLEAAYDNVLEPVDLDGFVGTDLKAIMDDWTNIYPVASTTSQPRTVYHLADPSTYKNMVEFLRFSVGNVRLHLTNRIAHDTTTGAATTYSPKSGAFINMSQWDFAYLMKPANTNLAPDGSGKKGFIDAVGGLRGFNPLGSLKVYSNS
jgi:hypothetical protein